MLYTKTVESQTLGLLKELSWLPILSKFALVGGTNLSLRYGHRKSIDLDFFTNEKFDSFHILNELKRIYPDSNIKSYSEYMWFMTIKWVKIDLVCYPYKLLQNIENIDGIKMMSSDDTIALKLNAIARRWVKKDFWDMAYILDKYSIKEILWFYQKKFDIGEDIILHLVRSLTYFGDADKDSAEVISLTDITRTQVKKKITSAVREFVDKEFEE